MDKKIFFMFLFLIVFSIGQVSAHFVCGQVLSSDDNLVADWFKVKLYYPGNLNNFAMCEVSPQDRKYCCDAESIPPQNSWAVGREVFAEVFDSGYGYFAGPVSIITSGEGYDVLPPMTLKKIMEVSSPSSGLVYSNISQVLLNVSFVSPFDYLKIIQDGNESLLCQDCNQYGGVLNFSYGPNSFRLIVGDGLRVYSEEFNFSLINGFEANREFNCPKCKNDRVKAGSVVDVKVDLIFSHNVEGIRIRDYVPVDWKILDTNDGEILNYSESHNVIEWVFSGQNFVTSYRIQAPNERIIPKRYLFKTEVEDLLVLEDEVVVYSFLPYLSSLESFSSQNFSAKPGRIYSSDRPFVVYGESFFDSYALFIDGNGRAYVDFVEISEADVSGKFIRGYEIASNINVKKISRVYIDFKDEFVEDVLENGHDVYFYSNGGWNKLEIGHLGNDKMELSYFSKIVVISQEESLFDRLF